MSMSLSMGWTLCRGRVCSVRGIGGGDGNWIDNAQCLARRLWRAGLRAAPGGDAKTTGVRRDDLISVIMATTSSKTTGFSFSNRENNNNISTLWQSSPMHKHTHTHIHKPTDGWVDDRTMDRVRGQHSLALLIQSRLYTTFGGVVLCVVCSCAWLAIQ